MESIRSDDCDLVELVVDNVLKGQKVKNAIANVLRHHKGIGRAALSSRYYRSHPHSLKSHGNKKLKVKQEQELIVVLLSFSSSNVPFQLSEVPEIIRTRFNVEVKHNWAKRFVDHHPDILKVMKTKTISNSRVDVKTMVLEEQFCDVLERHMKVEKYQAHAVMNYDETHFNLGSETIWAIVGADQTGAVARGEPFQSLCSLLVFISADGYVFKAIIILEAHFDPNTGQAKVSPQLYERSHDTRSGLEVLYAFSEHGYLTGDLFNVIIHRVVDDWRLNHKATDLYLFGDQLAAHLKIEAILYAHERCVYMWYFPPHCTHVLQPLDSFVFANLKRGLRIHFQKAICRRLFVQSDKREAFFTVIYQVINTVFTKKTIKGSFDRTGIFPYDREKILERSRKNIGFSNSDKTKELNETINTCNEIIKNRIIDQKKATSKTRKYTVVVKGQTLYCSEDIVSLHRLVLQQDCIEAELLQEKRDRTKASKERREEHRLTRKCSGALTCRRRWCTQSTVCKVCENAWFCPDHVSLLQAHIDSHNLEDPPPE